MSWRFDKQTSYVHGIFRYCSSRIHAGTPSRSWREYRNRRQVSPAIVTYLAIYGNESWGFAIILSVSRTTRSAKLKAATVYSNLSCPCNYDDNLPRLTCRCSTTRRLVRQILSIYLPNADGLKGPAVIAAINAVIAFGYYGRIAMKCVEDPHNSIHLK